MKKRNIRHPKTRKFTTALVACLLTLTQFCYAGNTVIGDSTTYKLFSRKIQLQASVGAASTNFSFPTPNYGNLYLSFIHADLFLIKNLRTKSDIRVGVAYEPIGYGSDVYLSTGESSYTKTRLFYGNIHLLYGYQLSKQDKRFDVRALTGVFGGWLIDNDMVSLVQPGNKIYRNRNTTTYNSWNAGISLSISGSLPVGHKSAVGLKILYSAGLSNIINPEATSRSGVKRYTRSIGISTFYNF